jgi:hypothetical protein
MPNSNMESFNGDCALNKILFDYILDSQGGEYEIY